MNRLETTSFTDPTPKMLGWVIAICLHVWVGYWLLKPQTVGVHFNLGSFISVQLVNQPADTKLYTKPALEIALGDKKTSFVKAPKPKEEKNELNASSSIVPQKLQKTNEYLTVINRTVTQRNANSLKEDFVSRPPIAEEIITTAPVQTEPAQSSYGPWQLTKNNDSIGQNFNYNESIALKVSCPVAIKAQDLTTDQTYKVCSGDYFASLEEIFEPGYCDVIFDITSTGRLRNVKTKFCSEQYLEAPTLVDVKKWYFFPEIKNGKPVMSVGVKHKVTYSVGDDSGGATSALSDLNRKQSSPF